MLCDGDDHSAFEIPWSNGVKEVVATIDLGKPIDVTAVRWTAGDANWIFKADVLISSDGTAYVPVEGAQNVDLHAKWGGPHAFPWARPMAARYVRLRFHNDGKPSNAVRLPPTVSVYDGIANDAVAVPQVGPVVASGEAEASVPPRGAATLSLRGKENLTPGAYLLGLELSLPGRKETRWSHVFVLPDQTVATDATRRFGVNVSSPDATIVERMRRCGFGWVRYENAKWQMYMPRRDHAAFDGSVGPWHLKFDEILGNYQRAGMRVLPYVFQTPAWASSAPPDAKNKSQNYPPKDPADYGDAVFQLVARFGRNKVDPSLLKTADKQSAMGLIDAVELWNEPNLNDPNWGPFVGPMSRYFDVMRAGAEGSRRADPSLPVTTCGFAGIGLEIVGQLSEHRYADGKTPLDLVDVINVHYYSGREDPETAGSDPNVHRATPAQGETTYPEQLEDLVEWRDRLKAKAEIWMTETGNDVSGPIGLSERYQAAKVPRSVLLALAAGVDRVFVYRETGSRPAMHEGAGLLRDDGSFRPAWLTVATMIRQMQGIEGRALRLPSDDPKVWMLLWQTGERRVVTAWTIGAPKTLGVNIGAAQVCDGFGRTIQVPDTAGVQLSDVPTYLALTQPSPALDRLVTDAKKRGTDRAEMRRRLAETPMRLFDFGPPDHVGMLKGHGPPRRFTAVGKSARWDEKVGYGFTAPPTHDEDARWIGDALERDGCRVNPGTSFQFRLDPGPHVVRVRVTPFQPGKPMDVTVEAGGATGKRTITGDKSPVEFEVRGGPDPVEVTVSDVAILRWITAIPRSTDHP